MTLRGKLVALLTALICAILAGQTLFWLSGEITDLDHRIETAGTIHVQGLAAASAPLLAGDDPRRFAPVLARATRTLDVKQLSITDARGRILGDIEPSRVGGAVDPQRLGVFGRSRAGPGLVGLLGDKLVYQAVAPIVSGGEVLGFVVLVFRSAEIAEQAGRLLRGAAALALVWVVLGATVGTMFVRRITRPLAGLTEAARSFGEGASADVDLPGPEAHDEVAVLQRSFHELLSALRAERAENADLLDRLQQGNDRLRQRVEDVTADLRRTAAYLEAVFRCIEDGIVTCDEDGNVVQANAGAGRQLAGLGEPRAGMPIAALVPDGERLGEALREVVRGGQAQQLELARACEGVDRTLVFRLFPLRQPSGTRLGAVVVVRDETGARQVESRMRRQDRLASLGTIAAGLGHELGNQLHAIGGFTALVLRKTGPEDPRRPDLQAVNDAYRRAVALIESFLQFARPGQMRFTPAPLGTIAREALDICSYRLRPAGIEVVDDLGEGGPEVVCDARLITQVFVNVILNAADAMSGRSERRLRLSREGADRAVVVVEDTGGGIPAAYRERIFDPFFTTKGTLGTGLGLSIAHQIMERHGGAITARSRDGIGTTFMVELPRGGPPGEPA